jgi:hypothetical protein
MGCNYQGDLICKENDENFTFSPNRTNGQFLKNELGSFIDNTYFETIKKFKWEINKDYQVGDICFVENIDFNGFKDPARTFFVCIQNHTASKFIIPNKSTEFWEKDGCSKTISACKKRFKFSSFVGNSYTAYNDSDTVNGVLPFGGFPGTDKFRYET